MEFRRITSLPPYVFTIIDGLKIEARRAGEDVIDFGFGNPDLPSPAVAVDKIVEAVRNPRNHRYSASRGIPKLREAVSDLYLRRFGRRARSRDRDHQHDRCQGRVLAPDVDAAPTGRRRLGAVSVLPDPHLRPAVRRCRHPRGAARHRHGFLREPARGVGVLVAEAAGSSSCRSRTTRRRRVSIWPSCNGSSTSHVRKTSWSYTTTRTRTWVSTATNPRRSCRPTARRTLPSSCTR